MRLGNQGDLMSMWRAFNLIVPLVVLPYLAACNSQAERRAAELQETSEKLDALRQDAIEIADRAKAAEQAALLDDRGEGPDADKGVDTISPQQPDTVVYTPD
ncbi:hypothetical protein ASD76_06290 [Altererythrobacter sp. Root672]|nr:hypothetical protein ASD76_06290 [Altererythrobacter sp. Root672]